MKQMILRIDKKTGEMQLTVNGVSGPACKEFTAPIEAGLGVVTSDEPTPDMYEPPVDDVIKQEG